MQTFPFPKIHIETIFRQTRETKVSVELRHGSVELWAVPPVSPGCSGCISSLASWALKGWAGRQHCGPWPRPGAVTPETKPARGWLRSCLSNSTARPVSWKYTSPVSLTSCLPVYLSACIVCLSRLPVCLYCLPVCLYCLPIDLICLIRLTSTSVLLYSKRQDTGYRIQDVGYSAQGTVYWIQVTVHRIQGTGYRVQDTGYRIQGT